MTNTPSPDEDRELIERKITRILERVEGYRGLEHERQAEAIYSEVVESLLSDRAKLEEAMIEARTFIYESEAVPTDPDVMIAKIDAALNRSTDRG